MNLDNITAFDLEMPNGGATSICQFGIVNVFRGKIKYDECRYINPHDYFQPKVAKLIGINQQTVEKAQDLEDYWPSIEKFFVNSIVIGHNVKNDIRTITLALKKRGIRFPRVTCICTEALAKRCVKTDSYKLDSLCEQFGIYAGVHHNARDDAMATLHLYEYLKENFGIKETDIFRYRYTQRAKRQF